MLTLFRPLPPGRFAFLKAALWLLGLLAAGIASMAVAMNVNLNLPWSDKCSPPQKPFLSFYSPQSDTLIFENQPKITIFCQSGLRSVGLSWSLHRNMLLKPFREGQAEALPPDRFKIEIDTAGLEPGFYDLRVKLDHGTNEMIDGVCGFGWQPEKMALRDTRPPDFLDFWRQAMAAYAKVPLDARMEGEAQTFTGKQIDEYNVKSAALPPDYDPTGHRCDEVESYKISFAGPDGGRVYGWLAKPKGPGPFPAMLVLPGAGFASRPRPLEHARHGFLALDIQIHGQDVDLPNYPQIPGYNGDWVYDPPPRFYFQNVYLRAVRAVDYLCSRPDVDKNRVVLAGGSQGGRLAIVVAALDQRVKAAVSAIANSPNYPALRWAAGCNGQDVLMGSKIRPWPRSDGMDLHGAPPDRGDAESRCWAYYDPMNFAPDIRCPVMMNSGMIDPVSPPTSVWAVYLRLAGVDKTLVPLPGLAHDWSAEFDRRAWRWLDRELGLQPVPAAPK